MFAKHIRFFAIINILLAGLIASINLNEWIKVGVLNQTSDYPFGSKNTVPWYYSSSEYYSNYTMIIGFCFLLFFIIALWVYDKKSVRINIVLLLLNLLTAVIEIFIGIMPP